MDIRIIEEASEDIVTLDEVKLHLRVDFTEDDTYIQSLIKTATEFCENFTGRIIKTKTIEMLFYSFPINLFKLPVFPLKSINSVSYKNRTGDSIIIDPVNYTAVTDVEPPLLISKTQWPTDLMTLPQTPWTYEVYDDPRVRFPNDRITIPGTVKVEAVAGYDTVPQNIKHAVLLLCDHFYENREVTSNFKGKENEIPFSVSALIYPYKILRW